MSSTTVKNIDVCGIVLPNKPLTNLELLDAAKKLNILNFRGFFMRDDLPKKPKRNECGILNLDDSGGKGTHYVGWVKNREDKLYFDSYGLLPPTELLKYLGDPVYYNSERIQPDNEVFCGHLCLYVLKAIMNDGRNFQEIINDLY
jgi:hypothetical protein